MEATSLELKYCERCGALGLRQPESNHNYCQPCADVLSSEFSLLHLARRAARRACAALHTSPQTEAAAAEVLP